MKSIILLLLLLVFISLFSYKEHFTDEENNIMIERVKSYPRTFSVDPFYNSTFKPECCPNIYSTSSGCLCIDRDIFSMIYSRGGNSYSFKYAS